MKICVSLLYFYFGLLITIVSPFLETQHAPNVFPLIPCGSESGDTVTLGCLATGFNPSQVTFSWTKQNNALSDSIQYPAVLKGDTYTGVSQVNVTRQDWDARQPFQCAVFHAAGNETVPLMKPGKTYAVSYRMSF